MYLVPQAELKKYLTLSGVTGVKNTVSIDLSNAKTDFTKCKINKEDMVLIAMPSFGGIAPAVAIERLKQIKGNGAKCTIICSYGNRDY